MLVDMVGRVKKVFCLGCVGVELEPLFTSGVRYSRQDSRVFGKHDGEPSGKGYLVILGTGYPVLGNSRGGDPFLDGLYGLGRR